MTAGWWPEGVKDAVAEHITPAVWNDKSSTYKTLNKRVCHTVEVWRERYGPLTPEQEEYVGILLVHAVKKATAGAGDKQQALRFLHTQIARLVNHEEVHAGFKRRGEKTVDVTALLAAA